MALQQQQQQQQSVCVSITGRHQNHQTLRETYTGVESDCATAALQRTVATPHE